MRKISATIITHNEEKRIGSCLESIKNIVDEIIVVDSFSTDRTVEICKSYENCIVSQRRFAGYGAQKQYAVSLSTNSYILSIDADEVINSDLQKALLEIKSQGFAHRIYEMNLLNYYCNTPVKHCGLYPDYKVRLFDKRYASWNLRDVNEAVIFPASLRAQPINGLILHYKCNTPKEYQDKENYQASINARILIAKEDKPALYSAHLKWLTTFLKIFFFKRGFMDGRAGKEIALAKAKAAYITYKIVRKSK